MKINFTTIAICIITFVNITGVKAQENSPVADLPLQLSSTTGKLKALMLYISGDGGWNNFNQQLVAEYENAGYGVIALNSRRYFWNRKSPELFARDMEQLIGYFMKKWNKSEVIVVGYSFGADVASFLPNLVSVEMQKKMVKLVLISPSFSSDFEIKLSDLIGENENLTRKYNVEFQIEKLSLPVVCIFGEEEQKVLKSKLSVTKNRSIFLLPGDHRYNTNFTLLSKMTGN